MEEYFLYCIFALIFYFACVFDSAGEGGFSGKAFSRVWPAGEEAPEEMLVALHSELRRIKAELAENRREMEYFRKNPTV